MVDQTQRNYNYSTLKSVNLVWNQALRNTIFEQEFQKLGIDAGRDQLEQIISSDDSVIIILVFKTKLVFSILEFLLII